MSTTSTINPSGNTPEELINISSDDEDAADLPPSTSHQISESTEADQCQVMPEYKTSHRTARKTITRNPNAVDKNEKTQEHPPTLKPVPITKLVGPKRLRLIDLVNPPSKKKKEDYLVPSVNLRLFGGSSKILKTVKELAVQLKETDIYDNLGVNPPRGFLLHGPPGCGKTLLAQAIAGELQLPLVQASAPELIGGAMGEPESRIRLLFDTAVSNAPCVLFIDEIDVLCPSRNAAPREMERSIFAQLLMCIDGLSDCLSGDNVALIGATNQPDAVDPALRRAGRFDRQICLGIPDRNTRHEILQVLSKSMKLERGLDLNWLAAATPGFVGADLKALMAAAATAAVNRCLESNETTFTTTLEQMRAGHSRQNINGMNTSGGVSREHQEFEYNEDTDPESQFFRPQYMSSEAKLLAILKLNLHLLNEEQLIDLHIETEDFLKALKSVQPSAKKEGFTTTPDVSWHDLGSLSDIRSEIERSLMMPIKYPKEFVKLGSFAPSGILLCGPPGCGKTSIAKAVANDANVNFISIKGPELLTRYLGECERAVRLCFQRARNSKPCVLFFDEIDSLCPKRTISSEGHDTTSIVVNQLLTEMDGTEDRTGVFLMAATNRLDKVDPAILRPGRLEKIVYVGFPSPADRVNILKTITEHGTMPPMKDVDLESVGTSSVLEGYSGADLSALVKEAALLALSDYIDQNKDIDLCVTPEILFRATEKINPSLSPEEMKHYENLRLAYGLPSKSAGESS